MELRKINKKAQVSQTLTWIIALPIVIIIIVTTISVTIYVLSGERVKIWEEEDKIVKGVAQPRTDLTTTNTLISFLETEVGGEKMKDLILSSLDVYIENDVELSTLHDRRPFFGEILIVARQKDEPVFRESQKILKDVCTNYMLKIPQGVVKPGEDDFVPEDDFLSPEWDPWSELYFPYKDQIIKIKYRQLKRCVA